MNRRSLRSVAAATSVGMTARGGNGERREANREERLANSERRRAKSVSLLPALPAQPNASQDRLPQSRYWRASDLVLIVGQVLALEEHVESLRPPARHSCAEHEVGAQRQQVLIVIEFVAGGAALYCDEDLLRSGPRPLEDELVFRHQRNLVPNQGRVRRKRSDGGIDELVSAAQPNAVGDRVVDAGLQSGRLNAAQVPAHAHDELRSRAEGYVGNGIGDKAPEAGPVKRHAVLQHGDAHSAFAAGEVLGAQVRIGEGLHVAYAKAAIKFVQRGRAKRAIRRSIKRRMFAGVIRRGQPRAKSILAAVRVNNECRFALGWN